MVKTHLAESAVDVDLVFVLGSFDLHLALEVLSEFEHVFLFGHDLVGEGASSD